MHAIAYTFKSLWSRRRFPHPALVLMALSLISARCGGQQQGLQYTAIEESIIPYTLLEPDTTFVLPQELVEVSGLTSVDSGYVAAIQDEDGIVYMIDITSGVVARTFRFGDEGDYEGIASVDEEPWVLRSDGALFRINTFAGHNLQVSLVDTDLHSSCDAEGLEYQPDERRLLIACKENPGQGLGRTRGIYAFNLELLQVSEHPVYLLDREELHGAFKPSAIAQHPETSHFYILSASQPALVVLDPTNDGNIIEAIALPPVHFPQPEGIAFLPDGTLLIASEGRRSHPVLHKFSITTNPDE